MAGFLIFGAIPSGLAGTANSATHLYILRFFIGEMIALISTSFIDDSKGAWEQQSSLAW